MIKLLLKVCVILTPFKFYMMTDWLFPDCRFSKTAPNVVHMSVKPQETVDDEDGNGKEQGSGAARPRSSNCCVIL
jgi:hypothetical protein